MFTGSIRCFVLASIFVTSLSAAAAPPARDARELEKRLEEAEQRDRAEKRRVERKKKTFAKFREKLTKEAAAKWAKPEMMENVIFAQKLRRSAEAVDQDVAFVANDMLETLTELTMNVLGIERAVSLAEAFQKAKTSKKPEEVELLPLTVAERNALPSPTPGATPAVPKLKVTVPVTDGPFERILTEQLQPVFTTSSAKKLAELAIKEMPATTETAAPPSSTPSPGATGPEHKPKDADPATADKSEPKAPKPSEFVPKATDVKEFLTAKLNEAKLLIEKDEEIARDEASPQGVIPPGPGGEGPGGPGAPPGGKGEPKGIAKNPEKSPQPSPDTKAPSEGNQNPQNAQANAGGGSAAGGGGAAAGGGAGSGGGSSGGATVPIAESFPALATEGLTANPDEVIQIPNVTATEASVAGAGIEIHPKTLNVADFFKIPAVPRSVPATVVNPTLPVTETPTALSGKSKVGSSTKTAVGGISPTELSNPTIAATLGASATGGSETVGGPITLGPDSFAEEDKVTGQLTVGYGGGSSADDEEEDVALPKINKESGVKLAAVGSPQILPGQAGKTYSPGKGIFEFAFQFAPNGCKDLSNVIKCYLPRTLRAPASVFVSPE